METLLPSEVARLVLGYLEEEKCDTAAKCFFNTSPHLSEYRSIASKGKKYPTKVNGYSLRELLEENCQVHCIVQESLSSMTEQPAVGGNMIDCLRFLVRACQPVQVHINLHPQQGLNSSFSKTEGSDVTSVSSRQRSRKTTISQGQCVENMDSAFKPSSEFSSILPETSPVKSLTSQSNVDQSLTEQHYLHQTQSMEMPTRLSQNVNVNRPLSSSEQQESEKPQETCLAPPQKNAPQDVTLETHHVPHQEMFQNLEIYREPPISMPKLSLPETSVEPRNTQQQVFLPSNVESAQQISTNELASSQDCNKSSFILDSCGMPSNQSKQEEPVRSYSVTKCYGSNIVILENDDNIPESNLPCKGILQNNNTQDMSDSKRHSRHKPATPNKVLDAEEAEILSKKILESVEKDAMIAKLVDNINRVWTPLKQSADDESQPLSGCAQSMDDKILHSISEETVLEPCFDQFILEYLQNSSSEAHCRTNDGPGDTVAEDSKGKKKKKNLVKRKDSNDVSQLDETADSGVINSSLPKQSADNVVNDNEVSVGSTTPLKVPLDNDTMTPMTKLLKSITSPSGELFLDPTQFAGLIDIPGSAIKVVSPNVPTESSAGQPHPPSHLGAPPQQHEPPHHQPQLQPPSYNSDDRTLNKILQLPQPNGTTVNVPILICSSNQQVAQYVNEKGVSTICEIQVVPHQGGYLPIVPRLQPGESLPPALPEIDKNWQPEDKKKGREKKETGVKQCRTRGGRLSGGQKRTVAQNQSAPTNIGTMYAAESGVEVSSTFTVGGSSDLPILLSSPAEKVSESYILNSKEEVSTSSKQCDTAADQSAQNKLLGGTSEVISASESCEGVNDEVAPNKDQGHSPNQCVKTDHCRVASSQTANSENSGGAPNQTAVSEGCQRIPNLSAESKQSGCVLDPVNTSEVKGDNVRTESRNTQENCLVVIVSEECKGEDLDSAHNDGDTRVPGGQGIGALAAVSEEKGSDTLPMNSSIRNTPALNGPLRPLDKRMSFSTPRRRPSYIRALDFNTPPKENDLSLRKANTSPKNMSTHALSPHTSGKTVQSCGRQGLFKPPLEGSKRTSKVKAHLFKSPEYALSLSSGFKIPSVAVTSSPHEPSSPFQRPSAAWDKVSGVSLILDSEEVSPVVKSDFPGKKAAMKSWDADLRSLLGSMEEQPTTSNRKRKIALPAKKKPAKKVKKEREPKPGIIEDEDLNKSKNVSTESECDMAKLIEQNLMEESAEDGAGSTSISNKANPSKPSTSHSSATSEILDIEENIVAYHIEKDPAGGKAKEDVPLSDESSTSSVPSKIDSHGKSTRPSPKLQDRFVSACLSETSPKPISEGMSSADNPVTGEKITKQLEAVSEKKQNTSGVGSAPPRRVRLSQEMLKESFSFNTPLKMDLANMIPQTPRFLSPNSGANEDTPRTKIIRALPFPTVPCDSSVPTPTVPPTPTIHTTPSVSPCGPSYFQPSSLSQGCTPSKNLKDCSLENILIQECTRIEADTMHDFRNKSGGSNGNSGNNSGNNSHESSTELVEKLEEEILEENDCDVLPNKAGERRSNRRRNISRANQQGKLNTKDETSSSNLGCARLQEYGNDWREKYLGKKKSASQRRAEKNIIGETKNNICRAVTSSSDETDLCIVVSPSKDSQEWSKKELLKSSNTAIPPVGQSSKKEGNCTPSSPLKSFLALTSPLRKIGGIEIEKALDQIHGTTGTKKNSSRGIANSKSPKKMPLVSIALPSKQKQAKAKASSVTSGPQSTGKSELSKPTRKDFSTPMKRSPAKKSIPSSKKKVLVKKDETEFSEESSDSSSSSSSSDSDSDSTSSSSSEEGTPVKENVSPVNLNVPHRTRSPISLEKRHLKGTIASSIESFNDSETILLQSQEKTILFKECVSVQDSLSVKDTFTEQLRAAHSLDQKDVATSSQSKIIEIISPGAHAISHEDEATSSETHSTVVKSQLAPTLDQTAEVTMVDKVGSDVRPMMEIKVADNVTNGQIVKSRLSLVTENVSFMSELKLKRQRTIEQMRKNESSGSCAKNSKRRNSDVARKLNETENESSQPQVNSMSKEKPEPNNEQGTKDPDTTTESCGKNTKRKKTVVARKLHETESSRPQEVSMVKRATDSSNEEGTKDLKTSSASSVKNSKRKTPVAARESTFSQDSSVVKDTTETSHEEETKNPETCDENVPKGSRRKTPVAAKESTLPQESSVVKGTEEPSHEKKIQNLETCEENTTKSSRRKAAVVERKLNETESSRPSKAVGKRATESNNEKGIKDPKTSGGSSGAKNSRRKTSSVERKLSETESSQLQEVSVVKKATESNNGEGTKEPKTSRESCAKNSRRKTPAVERKLNETKSSQPQKDSVVKTAGDLSNVQCSKEPNTIATCSNFDKKRRSKSEPNNDIGDAVTKDHCAKPRSLSDNACKQLSDEDEEFKLHLSGDEKDEVDPIELEIAAIHGHEGGTVAESHSKKESVTLTKIPAKCTISSKSADSVLKSVVEKGLGCALMTLPSERIKKIPPKSNEVVLESKSNSPLVHLPENEDHVSSNYSLKNTFDKRSKGNSAKPSGEFETGRIEILDTSSSNTMDLLLTYEGLGNFRSKPNLSVPQRLQYLLDEGCKLVLTPTSYINLFSATPSKEQPDDCASDKSKESGTSRGSEVSTALKMEGKGRSDTYCKEQKSSGERSSRDQSIRYREEKRYRRERSPSPRYGRGRDYDCSRARDTRRSQNYTSQPRIGRRKNDSHSPHRRRSSGNELKSGDLNSKLRESKRRETEEGEILSSDDERGKKPSSKSRKASSPVKARKDWEHRNSLPVKKSLYPLSDRRPSRLSEVPHTRHHFYSSTVNSSPEEERKSSRKRTQEKDYNMEKRDVKTNKAVQDQESCSNIEDEDDVNLDDDLGFPVLGDDETDENDSKSCDQKLSPEENQSSTSSLRRAPPRSVNAHKSSLPGSTISIMKGKRKLSASVEDVSEDSCQSLSGSLNTENRRCTRRGSALVPNTSTPATKIPKTSEGESIPVPSDVIKNLDVESFLSKIHGQD